MAGLFTQAAGTRLMRGLHRPSAVHRRGGQQGEADSLLCDWGLGCCLLMRVRGDVDWLNFCQVLAELQQLAYVVFGFTPVFFCILFLSCIAPGG
jgi:hypothetical protein